MVKQIIDILEKDIIKAVYNEYGIMVEEISDVIDTSHGEKDLRYNFIINYKYVLKMNSTDAIAETFLQGINRLMMRYRSIGVWCPKLLENKNGSLIFEWSCHGIRFNCYIEEYAPYKIVEDAVEFYTFKEEMLEHVGKLAARYTNVDLAQHKSMWSIIDLSKYDDQIDEKQENLNMLIKVLEKHGYTGEAKRLIELNDVSRSCIREYFDVLPRCVYQGDLNPSNLLIDDQKHFVGIIDFNMYGTEVNINCFLNECMYYLNREDFEELTAKEIFEKMNQIQQNLLGAILKNYTLNEVEHIVFEDYKKVINMSFYPNVMLLIDLIENNRHVDKVIQLIHLFCE